nr:reverse transcriptase domain-containing protein [Tanacetum cinerariifolium]
MTRQKVTQSFERVREITFSPLTTSSGAEGPLVMEAEIGGHMIHRMYVDRGSLLEILYEHCFNRLRLEVKNQMVPTTTSLSGFSGETIWPLGQLRLLPSDMTGVPRSVAEHRLNIREGYSPVRQKKKGQAPVRAKAIQAEVKKLVKARIMREVYYHNWLSNPVMVKKYDDSWRMCVDFTNLNKACPQDCYPLLEIDWKVESLCGYPFKCFLDAYKGYYRIQLAELDEEKTAFHTGQGVYCYTKMPFGLRNAGATYQRLVDKAFYSQIGWNIEVPFPDKTDVVLQLPSPRTIKEVQSLNGKLASMNRFLSKSAEKSLPLFKTLKKCIKKTPKPKEELIAYLSASYGATSAVLMTERGAVQMPFYFVSRALQGPKLNYTPMEKLVLLLVFVAKRLRRYFQAHPIAVVTDQTIKQIMSRPDVLANFLAKVPDESPPAASVVETQQEQWKLFMDGSSCVDRSDARLILTSPKGTKFTYALRFQFAASNNEAEYEALIAGLRIAAQIGLKNVHVSVDSKLVANQVLGTYIAKEENMIKYLENVKSLSAASPTFP